MSPRGDGQKGHGYQGVWRQRRSEKYAADVKVDGVHHNCGTWEDPRDAAIARDRGVLYLGLDAPLNLPKVSAKLGPASPQELRCAARRKLKRGAASSYVGVHWYHRGRCWQATVSTVGGQQKYVARFDDEENAAIAYDRVARWLHGERATLNFPTRDLEPATFDDMKAWARELRAAAPRLRIKPADRTSRYWGVTFHQAQGKYAAFVKFGGERVHVGMYDEERTAAVARDRAVLYFEIDVPLNLPKSAEKRGPASPHELRREARRAAKRNETSRYFGVTWDSGRGRWAALLCTGEGRSVQIAQFDDERDAAEAYDRVALGVFGEVATLNFPERDFEPKSMDEMREWAWLLRKQRTSSKYRGVTWLRKNRAWLSQIAVHRRHRHLGLFDDEEEAARAYDRAALAAFGGKARPNFHPETDEPLYGGRALDSL